MFIIFVCKGDHSDLDKELEASLLGKTESTPLGSQ